MTFSVCLDFILGESYAGKGSDGDSSLTYSIVDPTGTEIAAATAAGLTEKGGQGTSGSYSLAIEADTDWSGDFARIAFYDGGTLLPWVIGTIELVTMRTIADGPAVQNITEEVTEEDSTVN